MASIKELLDKKKAAQAGGAPASKPVNGKPAVKAAAKAQVVEDDEEGGEEEAAEEEEEAPKPVKKGVPAKGGKPAPKKAAPVEEEEETTEEEETSEEEEGSEDGDEEGGEEEAAEEEEEAPKPVKKGVPAKPAAKAPVGKPAAKPAVPAKAAAKPASKKVADEEEAPAKPAKKGSAWGKKPEKERRELKPGSWMPQDEFLTRFHEHLEEKGIAPPTKSLTTQIFKELETFMAQTLEDYDVKFIGKTKRREMDSRVYAPNTELAQVATPYHTRVSPHTKVSLSLYFGKEMTKGTVTDDNEFVEGQFDDEGNFTRGKWGRNEDGEETFTPATKKPAAGKKK